MENSYKLVTEILQNMLFEISVCEKNRINEMNLISFRICFIWLSSIILIYIFNVIYFYKLSNQINFVWKMYFKKSLTSFPLIRGILINRLLTAHSYNYSEDQEKNPSKKNIHNQRFWIRYSLVTLSLVLIAISIVLLFINIFGLKIYISLEFRKSFIEIPLNRRVSVVKMPFNVIDKMSPQYKIESICNNSTDFGSYIIEHLKVQNELIRLRKRFNEKRIKNNVPSESWKIIFENFESDKNFIKLGITSALAFLRQETFYYWTNSKSFQLSDVSEYITDCNKMMLTFNEVLLKTQSSTSKVIDENLKSLVFYALASILFTIIISITLYISYFKKEIEKINFVRDTLSYMIESEEAFSKS